MQSYSNQNEISLLITYSSIAFTQNVFIWIFIGETWRQKITILWSLFVVWSHTIGFGPWTTFGNFSISENNQWIFGVFSIIWKNIPIFDFHDEIWRYNFIISNRGECSFQSDIKFLSTIDVGAKSWAKSVQWMLKIDFLRNFLIWNSTFQNQITE